jgi:uncharacterized protein (UPF0147 family)
MRKEVKKAHESIELSISLLKKVMDRDITPALVKERSQKIIETLQSCSEEVEHIANLYVQ